ncbi:hypothetical protein HAX54_017329 [Datura stramonium]|uniref:Uncharacterized protein n=1 Tax=Datura stramonium TaxID=4076 RepID=A0ABS8UMS2_DATST|nr:hypothetical protein [Datura stramonium]
MDLGVFETFGLKLKKKECTKEELKRKKIIVNVTPARQVAQGSSKAGATRRATRSTNGTWPGATRAFSYALAGARHCLLGTVVHATRNCTLQQLGVTQQRLLTPKNGSPTSTRKRNIKSLAKFIKEQAKHESITINTIYFHEVAMSSGS